MYTPGPWKLSCESVDPEWAIVTDAHGLILANVNLDSRQHANAALIAAAPDLLAALERLMELPEIQCIERFRFLGIVEVDDARAAIAKVKGEK